jgi:hypothetical protein
MSVNLIDFPPWRKSGGPFEDLSFLAQDLILAPQPLQLSRHVFLPICRRMVDLVLAPAIKPVPQGQHTDPEIFGNRAPGSPAGLDQTDGLILEFRRKALL